MSCIDLSRIPVEQIDHEQLRAARLQYDEAQRALRDARRVVEGLQDGRTQARQRDAEERVEAKLTGKAAPKGKTHEQRFEEELADAERALTEAEVMGRRTRELLDAAAREHGTAWGEQVEAQAAAADELYHAAVSALLQLHEQRLKAHARCRLAGREHSMGAMIRLHPSVLVDSATGTKLELARLDDPAARWRQRALIRLDDVLEAITHVDEPEPDAVPFMPGGHMADQIVLAAQHARDVERGFSDEEIATNRAPSISQGHYVEVDGRRVPLHMPTGRGDE